MNTSPAEIIREYSLFSEPGSIHGVTYDGRHVWLATGEALQAFDPASGKTQRSIRAHADAGTAFDGTHLFQIHGDQIQKLDPQTGEILSTLPAPGGAGNSGLAWAEGKLWVGRHHDRLIHQIDPQTGAILHTIQTNRHVTGVTWADNELWHGTWENDESELRHIDAQTGDIIDVLTIPPGAGVSGLAFDGRDLFFCGGGPSGKLRVIRRP